MIAKKDKLGIKFDNCKIVNDNEGNSELPYYNIFDIAEGERSIIYLKILKKIKNINNFIIIHFIFFSITELCSVKECRLKLASIAEKLFKALLVLSSGESSLFNI